MAKRRGPGSRRRQLQPEPNNSRHHNSPPDTNLYKIKAPKVYSSYPYTSYLPEEVGAFSTDQDRNVLKCSSDTFPHLRPDVKLPLDLNEGLEEYYSCVKDVDSNRLNYLPFWQKLLKWITLSNFDVSSVDFIARRGILKYIGYTLYDYHKSPWKFRVCKFQGKVYMYEPSPEQRGESMIEKDSRCKRYLYWGRQFEKTVTSSKEDMAGYYRIVNSNVGKYKVLLGAELDAIRVRSHDNEGSDDIIVEEVLQGCPDCNLLKKYCNSTTSNSTTTEFIEIKTCVKRQVKNKTSFGWLQSYLAGIETLVYGFRDGEGMVDQIAEYKVSEVPGTADWDGAAMFGLISGVLKWLYGQVDEGCSGEIEYLGAHKHQIEFRKLSNEHFLPEWFVQYVSASKQ